MQVVVQQTVRGRVAVGGIISGSEGAGVLAEQVVQPVTAGRGLADQVLVIQLIEQAASLLHAGVIEGGGGVGVEVRAGDQAQAAEQPLRAGGEVGVGQVKRGPSGR